MSNNNLHLAFAFYTTPKNPALLVQISEGGPVMNRAGVWVNPPVLTPALDVAPSELSDAQHHMLDFLAAKEAAEVAKAAAERAASRAALAANDE